MLLILTACKSQSDEAQAPTYYQDIQPILESRCTGCHLEGGIAPFALDSYEKVSTYADAVAASVTQKTMPPWLAGPADVEYLADPQLDANAN
jgi:hypothetical protein